MMLRLVLDDAADKCLRECMELSGRRTPGEAIRDALWLMRILARLGTLDEIKVKEMIYEDDPT